MREVDEGALRVLIEQSQDLQVDAMRVNQTALDEFEDQVRSRGLAPRPDGSSDRSSGGIGLGRGAVIAGAAVAGVGLLARGAAAESSVDIMTLQTAASLENLAVATYGTALTLPYIANGNATVKVFAMTTMQQHSDHAKAFNARLTNLGAKTQTQPNPKYAPIVKSMVPKLMAGGPEDVVKLAILLEDIATSTYVKNTELVSDPQVRLLFASIMGVESQHLATLKAVQALLTNNLASEIALPPPDLGKLPMATASLAITETFKSTTLASPPSEGAVA